MVLWLLKIVTNVNFSINTLFLFDNGKHQHFPLRIQSTKSLNIISFTYDKVLRSLRNLPNKCSKTPDGFPAFFLKSIAPAIAFPLSCLFTMSMESGILPAVWKVGYVCPIFKKGARQLPSNYRPISMTSICCKVMESIISESMVRSAWFSTQKVYLYPTFGNAK